MEKMTCPGCKKETNDHRKDGWPAILVAPGYFGIRFCPECYEKYKDTVKSWNDLKLL